MQENSLNDGGRPNSPASTSPATPRHPSAEASNSPLIEINHVSVFREQTPILDRITLSIPQFRHTAILGPNGSGKSSLMKLLTRQFYPSIGDDGHQGTVSILGQEDWLVSELRRRMGLVSPTLDHAFCDRRTGGMSVVDAVASGVTATRLREFGPKQTPELVARIDHALQTVEMTKFRGRAVKTLSTGERRRVMIARAIVHEPEIFVMDEPTSGLDLVAAARFMEIVQSITERHRVTLLMVTHHLDEIPRAVDHVVLLDGGRVVFDGGKSDALTSERLSSLYGVPIDLEMSNEGWFRATIASGRR